MKEQSLVTYATMCAVLKEACLHRRSRGWQQVVVWQNTDAHIEHAPGGGFAIFDRAGALIMDGERDAVLSALLTRGIVRPEVGMRASYTVWTDTVPCTIVRVSPNGRRCRLRRDTSVVVAPASGFTGGSFLGHFTRAAVLQPVERLDGAIFDASFRPAINCWKCTGDPTAAPGGRIVLGRWEAYTDPNF